MIADLLRDLNDEGLLTARELSDLFQLTPGTCYRYYQDTPLRFEQLREILRRCRSRDARGRILALLLSGSGFVALPVDPDLDINGDGDVDTRDAMSASIAALDDLTAILKTIAPRIDNPAMMTDLDAAMIDEHAGHVITLLVAAQSIVRDAVERGRRTRRRAHAPRPRPRNNGHVTPTTHTEDHS